MRIHADTLASMSRFVNIIYLFIFKVRHKVSAGASSRPFASKRKYAIRLILRELSAKNVCASGPRQASRTTLKKVDLPCRLFRMARPSASAVNISRSSDIRGDIGVIISCSLLEMSCYRYLYYRAALKLKNVNRPQGKPTLGAYLYVVRAAQWLVGWTWSTGINYGLCFRTRQKVNTCPPNVTR